MYETFVIANYFIDKFNSDELELESLKLNKLIYVAHGWHLACFDNGLIDEHAECWKYGPIIPSIYYATKHLKNIYFNLETLTSYEISVETKELLDKVYLEYKNYSNLEMSSICNKKETVWDICFNGYKFYDKQQIPNFLLKNFYKNFIN